MRDAEVATGKAKAETFGDRWRKACSVILVVIGYMLPLFWFWQQTDFPDEFSVHITVHGRTGLLENWWYSYLLVQRHRPWDIATFIYMWAAAATLIGWIAHAVIKDRRVRRMTDIGDGATKKGAE